MRRKSLAVLVCVFALSAWVLAQDKDKDKDKSQAVRITNGPVVESVSSNSASIAWSTNTGGSSIVKYGTSPTALNQQEQEPYHEGHGTHRVKINNLQPGTTYYYQVISGHGQGTGTEATSQIGQFTTSGQGGGAAAAQGQAGAAIAAQGPGQAASSGTQVPLYRAYNPQNGSHLFSDNAQEIQNATKNLGFREEGVAGHIMKNQQSGTVPLYRLRGPNGDHFYTANAAEVQQAQAQSHYTNEGVAGYVASSQQPGTQPLYRLSNPNNGQHTYTTDANEHQQLLSQGWRDEGVVGYIWP